MRTRGNVSTKFKISPKFNLINLNKIKYFSIFMNMKLCLHHVLKPSGAYEVFRELNNEVQTRNSIKDIMLFSATSVVLLS